MAKQNTVDLPNALLSEEVRQTLEALFARRSELDELDLLEKKERRAQLEAERAIALRAKNERVTTLKRETENKLAQQGACQHRLQRGETALVGQFSSTGVLILSCQTCQKSYIGEETVPPGLMPPPERIGSIQIS